jgi:hypothetical protein
VLRNRIERLESAAVQDRPPFADTPEERCRGMANLFRRVALRLHREGRRAMARRSMRQAGRFDSAAAAGKSIALGMLDQMMVAIERNNPCR